MSFLDEATIKTTPEKLAKVKASADDDDTIEVMEKKAKPDYLDLDGDGDKKESMKKAAQDKKKGEVEEGKAGKALAGVAIVAALLGINKSVSEKIYNSSPKIKSLTSKYEEAKKDGDKEKMADYKEQIKKEKIKIDKGLDEAKDTVELPADTTFTLDLKHLMKKHLDEGKSKEDVIKLTKALMKKLHDKGEVTVKGTKVLFKENQDFNQLQADIDSLDDDGNIDLILKAGNLRDTPRNREIIKSKLDQGWSRMDILGNYSQPLDEEIGTQQYLVSYQLGSWGVGHQKIVNANSPEEAIDIVTRKIESDGYYLTTGVMGKPVISAKPMSTNEQEDVQLALPEPDAPNFLGDDGMDYEGGMAKSQLLKMKGYASALCDMIEDESQLEAWVQAKLTKASDYMSSVFHYLDYQNQKDERSDQGAY